MKNKLIIIFTVIWIAISLYVRLIGLDKSPLSVGFDEASLGYNAYSILLTGKDEYGTPYPLSLRSFNDFKPALYTYLDIPFIYFFDLNETSLRAPSAVLGTLSLIFLFLIFKKLSKTSWGLSLFVTSALSFLPWRLHFSRVAFESNISMCFVSGIVLCLLYWNKHLVFKIGAILFAVLAIYSYHAARLTVPLLLLLWFVDPMTLSIKKAFKQPFPILKKLWPLALVLILYIPLFWEAQANLILTRFGQTNVFDHFYPYTPSELLITSNVWLNPLAHPLYYLGGILVGHIFAYLSPQNLSLLLYQGVIKSAQGISGTGMLGILGGSLFTVGILTNARRIILQKEKRILAYWILAGIAPAALTWEWFYPLRSINIYPALEVISGFGLLWILSDLLSFNRKAIGYIGVFILTGLIFVISLYTVLNEWRYGAWDTNGEFQPGGYKEGVPLLQSLMNQYQTVYIDTPHAQNYTIFWFYMKYPPEKVQALAPIRNKPGIEGPPTFDYDKFIYKKWDWKNDQLKHSFLYWTSSEVKDEEIAVETGAKLYKVKGPLGDQQVSIVTKE